MTNTDIVDNSGVERADKELDSGKQRIKAILKIFYKSVDGIQDLNQLKQVNDLLFRIERTIGQWEKHRDPDYREYFEQEHKHEDNLDKMREIGKGAAMTPSEQLLIWANELENPENEILVGAEDDQVEKVAEELVRAAEMLRKTAEELEPVEVSQESLITPESLDELAILAAAFDDSDDEQLQKSAAVIDELLLTISADRSLIRKAKDTEDNRIETLKKLYKDTLTEQHDSNGVKEAVEAIKDSPTYKTYRSNEAPLSTRACPIHNSPMHRVSEGAYQCSLTNHVINWEEGWTTDLGNKVPPNSVSNQTQFDPQSFSTFNEPDSRANRMGNNT